MAGSLGEPELWLERAREALEAARVLRDREFYNESVSRAYYAMFYAAKAAVASEGVRSKKHSSVISAFGHLFAKTGRIDARLHRALMAAHRQRQSVDYLLGVANTEEDATRLLVEAADFVAAIKALLIT